MEFLRLEVEGEERINLTMISLGLTREASTSTGKEKHFSKLYAKEEVPTAAGLLSTSQMQTLSPSVCFATNHILVQTASLHKKWSYLTGRNG